MNHNELKAERVIIGAALKQKRVHLKLSQEKLNKLCGLCRYTITNIETGGRSYTIDSLIIYQNALKQPAI